MGVSDSNSDDGDEELANGLKERRRKTRRKERGGRSADQKLKLGLLDKKGEEDADVERMDVPSPKK